MIMSHCILLTQSVFYKTAMEQKIAPYKTFSFHTCDQQHSTLASRGVWEEFSLKDFHYRHCSSLLPVSMTFKFDLTVTLFDIIFHYIKLSLLIFLTKLFLHLMYVVFLRFVQICVKTNHLSVIQTQSQICPPPISLFCQSNLQKPWGVCTPRRM